MVTTPQLDTVRGIWLYRDWTIAATLLALGIGAFAFVFTPEISIAVQTWDNPAYSHCWLVLPIAAYLVWRTRRPVMAVPLQPAPWIAVWIGIPIAALWFTAHRLGIMEGRQLMAVALFQVLVASVLGYRVWRKLATPLLYLFFLVPFGEFLIPSLQAVTVRFVTAGIGLVGIPVFSDGFTIEIPEARFFVAEACAGLRFLIASFAFGVLYAYLTYTSYVRRAFFIALSVLVPIVANAIRVFAIILIAHFIGNAEAVETGHILWGWIFFSLIIMALILLGLPFRQVQTAVDLIRPSPIKPMRASLSALALVLVLVLVSAGQGIAGYLDRLGTHAVRPTKIELPRIADCTKAAAPAAVSGTTTADGNSLSSAYNCDGHMFVLTLRRYSPWIGARPLFSDLREANLPEWLPMQTTLVRPAPDAPLWQVRQVSESESEGARHRFAAIALWVNGEPEIPGLKARVSQALNILRRSPVSPVLAVVTSSETSDANSEWRALKTFLAKTGQVDKAARTLASAP